MLDFTELAKDGNDFELLIRELLYNKGLEVYWSGKGPDMGKDLLCIERYNSHFHEFTRRWLVQCKHNAISGKSVGKEDLDSSIENICSAFHADGYLLVCSTYPSSAVVDILDGISNNGAVTTAFWDFKTLERQLLVPENWNIVNMFFPKSAKRLGWQISKIGSNFWHASYNGSVFYISLRIGSNCEGFLPDISSKVDELQNLQLPEKHYIRLRAVHFDDKYTQYKLFVDYLRPECQNSNGNHFEFPSDVIRFCNSTMANGISYDIDIKLYTYSPFSDNFDLDHRSYYAYYISNYRLGMSRDDCNSDPFDYVYKDDPTEQSEEIKDGAFNDLVTEFRKIPFIRLLNANNAQVENIAFFSDNFAWDTTIKNAHYQIDNFFNSQIRFECEHNNFEKLTELLSSFPTSVGQHFELEQHHIFIPDKGYDKDEDSLFTLKIMVHPAGMLSKLSFRKNINQYMNTIRIKIIEYLNKC